MRCRVCHKDNGWFGSSLCEDHEIIYGCKVMIIEGFYKGKEGITTDETARTGWDDGSMNGFEVKLTDGKVVVLPGHFLERM